ncbi:MAG: endonuclease/exonuclease/phosphatase family protein [Rhodothermales bacterium]
MGHSHLLLLLSITLLAGCVSSRNIEDAEPLRAMTFNIRFDNPDDGPDAWPKRKEMVASMIRFHGADVAGLQEALKGQIDDLQALLPEYNWLGVGRADGEEAGEFSPIFYRTDRLEALRHDTFWLSETPEVPGSKSWDAAIERIATWAEFRDRETNERFLAVNTHFDHRGEEARARSAELILERIEMLADDLPVVLTGDFNTVESGEPYRILTGGLADALAASRTPHHGPTSTWSGFEAVEPDRRIDFIFVNNGMKVMKHAVLSDTWGDRFPSDHLPVLAEIAIIP